MKYKDMKWHLFHLVSLLAVFLLLPGIAQARTKLKYVHHGPITVEMRFDPREAQADPDVPPVVTVFYLKKKVARLVLDGSIGKPAVHVAQLDPANRAKEVVVVGYSGGAHCCADIRVVTALPRRETKRWKVVPLGDGFDGGIDELRDLDGDGLAELWLKDDRFLYAYDCYVCSYAPPLILSVRNGRKVNLTRRKRFRPLLRAEAEGIRRRVLRMKQEEPDESPNGLLAGYVAVETMLGNGPAAWRFMLKHHTPQTVGYCPVPNPKGGDCPVPEMELPFPLHLSIFLRETGYIRAE